MHGASFLIDPRVAELTPLVAITLSAGSLLVGWIVYDGLWSSYGEKNPGVATVLSIAMLFGAIYGFTQVFGGRGAFIQTGVLIGTLMTGNVWMCIVPSQHALVNATKTGAEQDPALSIRAKQRSIHNNYFTFPLLFIMLSGHFPSTYGHPQSWLVLVLFMAAGALIRQFFVLWHSGERAWWLLAGGGLVLFAVLAWLAPKPADPARADSATVVDAASDPADAAHKAESSELVDDFCDMRGGDPKELRHGSRSHPLLLPGEEHQRAQSVVGLQG